MAVAAKKKKKTMSAAAKAAAKMQAEIARRNKAFKAASAAEKRVLIAKDVLAQIEAKRFKPIVGRWIEARDKNNRLLPLITYDDSRFGEDDSVRELFLNETIGSCNCCALGAVFMSCTLYNNQTTVEDFDHETGWFDEIIADGGSFTNGLTRFFSRTQLMLIEIAFEGGVGGFKLDEVAVPPKVALAALNWERKHPNDKKRLIAIMQNIIKNAGKFVP